LIENELHQPEFAERVFVMRGGFGREAAEHDALEAGGAAAISDATVPIAMRAARAGGNP
jgi:hypothetical protein